jgi:putative inorganic carbon (HCO3(-)) transporter
LEKSKVVNFCDKIIIFLLYAIAFFLPISKAIIESLSITVIFIYLFKKIIRPEPIGKTPVNLTIFTYLAICFFSLSITNNLKISSRTFITKVLQDIVFLFAAIDAFNHKQKIRNFLYCLLASSMLLGIDGIYQCFTHKEFLRHRQYFDVPGLPRISASFYTANDFGCYLATVIPFVIATFFIKNRFKFLKFLCVGLFFLLFTCLILTVSRGTWLAFLCSSLFMGIWLKSFLIFLFILIFSIIALQSFYFPFLKERLNNLFDFFDISANIDRRVIWQTAWRMFRCNPLLGIGLGTFMFNFKKFEITPYGQFIPYAHNCYLQMAAEIGLIGLIAFLLILILFFYQGIRALNNKNIQNTFSWYVLLASLASILGYCRRHQPLFFGSRDVILAALRLRLCPNKKPTSSVVYSLNDSFYFYELYVYINHPSDRFKRNSRPGFTPEGIIGKFLW